MRYFELDELAAEATTQEQLDKCFEEVVRRIEENEDFDDMILIINGLGGSWK